MMEELQQTDQTDFYSIPPEVIDGYVLPHLGWNDLLRMRRVCSWTQAVVLGFMQLHPELAPELEINQDDKTFGNFLKMGIPTTRIFFNNASGEEFYDTAGKRGAKFLKLYGPLVKHLRVDEFSPAYDSKELAFLEALVNLETFESNMFGYKVVRKWKIPKKSPSENGKDVLGYPIPKSFDHIKAIKIGNNETFNLPNMVMFTGFILNNCLKLECVTLPFSEYNDPPEEFDPTSLTWAFNLFGSSLEQRTLGNLKIIDFTNYHSIEGLNRIPLLRLGSLTFLRLCQFCMEYNVKILNAGADWFDNWALGPLQPHLGTPIYSMVNLHPYALQMEMRNLEKIVILSSRYSNPGTVVGPDWPALKILDITIDSDKCGYQHFHPETVSFSEILTSNESIYHCFFQNVSRPALSELRLNFTDEASREALPEAEDIVSSCPNLKRLTLVNWPGANAALSKLWNGLPGLEEVCFENCENLGNAAFVGEDIGSSAFLNLNNLKKLSLKGLDKMPKVTDTLFSLVIRHMPLTHLTMTSSLPLKSVTLTGVRSLLDGKFAESVEKFSFEKWPFANVSSKKWTQLKGKFRSSSML